MQASNAFSQGGSSTMKLYLAYIRIYSYSGCTFHLSQKWLNTANNKQVVLSFAKAAPFALEEGWLLPFS